MKAARRDAGGFVLVTVLWAVAALAVLAAYIDGVVTSDLEYVIAAKRSLAAELERRDTETTLIYLFATGRMNHLGLILEEEQRFTDSLRGERALAGPWRRRIEGNGGKLRWSRGGPVLDTG